MLHIHLHHLIARALSRVPHLHRDRHASISIDLGRAHLHALIAKTRIAQPISKWIEWLVFAVEIGAPVEEVVVENWFQLRIARRPRLRQSSCRRIIAKQYIRQSMPFFLTVLR